MRMPAPPVRFALPPGTKPPRLPERGPALLDDKKEKINPNDYGKLEVGGHEPKERKAPPPITNK